MSQRPMVLCLLLACPSLSLGTEYEHKMFRAIERGNDGLLESFLRQGSPANLRSTDGTSLLHIAALRGTQKSVELLLRHGANANAANEVGVTPLMWSAGHPFKVRSLLEHGAHVHVRSALGNTPLMIAAAFPGNSKTVQELLKAGAEAYAVNLRGLDALSQAVKAGDATTAKLLLDEGTRQQIETSLRTNSLLAAAADLGSTEIVKAFLPFVPNLNGRDEFPGEQPLHAALLSGYPQLAQLLLEHGADVHKHVRTGDVPTLLLATYNETGDTQVVEALLEKGVQVQELNHRGESALTWARRRGHPEMIDLLENANVPEQPDEVPEIPDRELNLHAGNVQQLLRTAVGKSLALMQSSSDQFLARRKTCISCHHQNLTGVAIGWARDRGFVVNHDSVDSMVRRQRQRWRGNMERTYQMDDPVPVPGRFLGWGLWGLSALGHPNDDITQAAVWYLAVTQKPQGYWVDGFLRPPMGGSSVVSTVLAMRSLQLFPLTGTQHDLARRVRRAADWLSQQKPRYHQERVFRLLGLAWADIPSHLLADDRELLLSTQNEDGGWSQLEHLDSDAWATGQALVALHIAGGVDTNHPRYRRGVAYLLNTQFGDGSWFVRSRSFPFQPEFESGFPFGNNQWISIGGTAWATMALVLAADPSAGVVSRHGDPEERIGSAARQKPVSDVESRTETARTIDFMKDIRPILQRSCIACHAGDAPEANLLLTSRQFLIRGGDSGDPAIVPGDHQRSPLYTFVSGKATELQMPPLDRRDEYPPLSDEEITVLRAWIDQGAKWPNDVFVDRLKE